MKRLPAAERMALTVEEAAELMAVSRSQGYAMVREGQWPSVRVGRSVRIPRRALEAWMDEQTRQARGRRA